MDLFLGLLREASFSPDVSEIRITIYRLASNPKIADYLIYAARTGKKVRVVLELRARFDEEKNLAWAEKLSAAGCRVYYGTDNYKVHSKMCQIVFEKTGKDGSSEKKYITQISTGNYNEKTAKQYTDLSIITYDQEIGKAASRLFKDICKDRIAEKDRSYAPLAVSPLSMRSELLKLIRRD
jgi:polyphosphate kinase